MRSQIMVLTLSAILIASIGVAPAFAQIVEPIVVTTDSPSYSEGDTITISGEVRDLIGQAIGLRIVAPNGNIVTIAQLDVGDDKMFSTEITAGGKLWVSSGEYTIIVQYGSDKRVAEATFSFGVSGNGGTTPPPTGPSVDVGGFQVGYEITGGTVDGIQEDFDANSLIILITATDDGTLTIILPRAVIDTKLNGDDDVFFVLIDGEEVDFDEIETTDSQRTLRIDFPVGSEEIEIIGTVVIPEFGTIALMILAVAIISIIAVSAKTRLTVIPRY